MARLRRIRPGLHASADGVLFYERTRAGWAVKAQADGSRLGVFPTLAEARKSTTGDCYDAAAHRAQALFLKGVPREHVRICHGAVWGQGELRGVRFGHGWVEVADPAKVAATLAGMPKDGPWAAFPVETLAADLVTEVHDFSGGRDTVLPRTLYYAVGGVEADKVRRYTWEEACQHMTRTGIYGPWEDLGVPF